MKPTRRQPERRQASDAPVVPEPSRRLPDVTSASPVVATTDNLAIKEQPIGGTPLEDTPAKRRKFRMKFTKKRVIISIIVLIALGLIGTFTYLSITASKITNGGSIFDLIAPGATLKTDSEGRTNILIFGTSQGDAAHENADGGGGLWLTDSIMLVSMNKANNTAKMVSIPRDLWVRLAKECTVGDAAKINAAYECGAGLVDSLKPGANYQSQDEAGAAALMKQVANVTGITPQYYAHVNYNVLQQSVDAVGGIDVNVVGDGASGIYDTNFDWNCPGGKSYSCKNVYYPKDGTYHLNGLQALYLARARGDAGAYSYKNFGLARGDFDRQLNQQKILTALREKAQTAGVLANPMKVIGLLNALGNNVSTNISTSEMKTFLSTASKLKSGDIKSIDLAGDTPVVKTGEYSGQSIVLATSGIYDYTSIINLVAKQLSTNPAVSENATITIYNGGGVGGSANKLQTKLESAGLNVVKVANANPMGSDNYTIYVTKPDAFPKTVDYLTQTLTDISLISTAPPKTVPATNADIVIVINR